MNFRFGFAGLGLAVALAFPSGSDARPFRGPIAWEFLLCRFSDAAAPLHPKSYYEDMLVNSGTKGLADYIHDVSYGASSVEGSVSDWLTEPFTTDHESGRKNRRQRWRDCIATANGGRFKKPKKRVYVITAPGVDLVGFENSGAVGQDSNPKKKTNAGTALPEMAHEFGHGIGLMHSFGDNFTFKDGGSPGEYDNPWDLMSAAHIFVDPTGAFGGGPPVLEAQHLDEMGWLPMSRILTVGAGGVTSQTVTLAALTHPSASGYLMARVLFDPKDRFHYYTVEYRVKDGWDSGIPQNTLLINELQYRDRSKYYQTFLQFDLGKYVAKKNRPHFTNAPLQSISANGVTIALVSAAADHATVKIATEYRAAADRAGSDEYGPNACAAGYVWRAADDQDYVCVTPDVRAQTLADDADQDKRHRPGSKGCAGGYVRRDAFPHDEACVTAAVRNQARSDNAAAPKRLLNAKA
jgi:hypothetical protein